MKLQRYLVLFLLVGALGTHLTGFASYADAFSGPNMGKLLVTLTAVAAAYFTKSGGHEAELATAEADAENLRTTIRTMPFSNAPDVQRAVRRSLDGLEPRRGDFTPGGS